MRGLYAISKIVKLAPAVYFLARSKCQFGKI